MKSSIDWKFGINWALTVCKFLFKQKLAIQWDASFFYFSNVPLKGKMLHLDFG